MAVEDICSYDNNDNNNNKNKNMSLLLPSPLPTIDEVERFSGWESQLCVPQDSLDDIDWFPNFTDEIISLDRFLRTLEHESISLGVTKSMTLEPEHEDEDDDNSFKSKTGNLIDLTIAFVNKKQRSKRGGRPYNTTDDEWTSNARRKCSHCLTDDTPQWRIGPSGPKTLCNACGVRHKSGRLVPEYRPAASPTFDASKHSNFHKKILRRRHLN